MDGVRRVRAARGGPVNDVVLSVLAGGLQRYLASMSFDTRGLEVTALVPVSLRGAADARSLGNRISAVLVPLPVDLESEVPRFASTRRIMEQLKERSAWVGIDALLQLLDGLANLIGAAPTAADVDRQDATDTILHAVNRARTW